ncbi:hypothetical protein AB0I50_54915, partial [Streptomyces prunicolor]
MPHISARRLGSRADFERFLAGLRALVPDIADRDVFLCGPPPNWPTTSSSLAVSTFSGTLLAPALLR